MAVRCSPQNPTWFKEAAETTRATDWAAEAEAEAEGEGEAEAVHNDANDTANTFLNINNTRARDDEVRGGHVRLVNEQPAVVAAAAAAAAAVEAEAAAEATLVQVEAAAAVQADCGDSASAAAAEKIKQCLACVEVGAAQARP